MRLYRFDHRAPLRLAATRVDRHGISSRGYGFGVCVRLAARQRSANKVRRLEHERLVVEERARKQQEHLEHVIAVWGLSLLGSSQRPVETGPVSYRRS